MTAHVTATALGPLSPTAEKAIGIREVRALLAGECTRAEAISAMQAATRQYAKRQATWFRREKCFQPLNMPEAGAMETAQP